MKKILTISRSKIAKSIFTIFILLSSFQVLGTHFRYGNITWKREGINPNTVRFTVTTSWRRGYPWSSLGMGNINNPSTGNSIFTGYNFVPNAGSPGSAVPMTINVTSFSAADDWIYGVFEYVYTYPVGTVNALAYFEGGDRISAPPAGALLNNGDGTFRVEAGVTLGNANDAPVSTLPPFINMVVNQNPATYQIPAVDPNGDPLTFSLAPPISFTQTGFPLNTQPVGFSVSSSGLVSFNTVGKVVGRFYNGIVRITDAKGAFIQLDFLIKIVNASAPPVFDPPTPPNGFTFNVTPGTNINYQVNAHDPDAADNVTLFVNGKPVAATLTPGLPTSGPVGGQVMSTFNWTPALADVGSYVTTYIAQDPQGVQTPTTVNVNVACNTIFNVSFLDPSCPSGNDGSITLSVISGAGPFEYSIDNGANYVLGGNPFTFPGLPNGTYNYKIKESNGCVASGTQTLTGVDITPPTVSACTGSTQVADANCVFQGSGGTFIISDNCPGDLTLLEEYFDENNNKFIPGDLIFTLSQNAYSLGLNRGFPIGNNTVRLTVTDAAGNVSAPCSFTVRVIDDQSPVITCPIIGSTNRNTDPGTCSYTVQGTEFDATATDCSPVTLSYVLAGATLGNGSSLAGVVFNKGTTTIVWTASDGINPDVSCSFDVIVIDNENPTITCPTLNGSYTVNNIGCTYKVSGTEFDPTFSDNCPGATITNSFNNSNTLAGAAFPKGTTNVIWKVTDASGNSFTCSIVVNVVTTLSVTIPSAYALTPSAGTNINTIYIGYAPASALTLTAMPSGGSPGYTYGWATFPSSLMLTTPNPSQPQTVKLTSVTPGIYTVTVTVTDSKGCTTTATLPITVVDVRCGNKNDKVSLCHVPPGNPANAHTNCISPNAVSAHLSNGSYLGKCTNGNRTAKPEIIVAADRMSIYPNPTGGVFNLQLSNIKASKATIVITNGNGLIVEKRSLELSGKRQNQTLYFDLMKYASGLYYVQLITPEGIKTDKVMLQR